MQVVVKLELGHMAQAKDVATLDGHTHDWKMFVKGPDGIQLEHFVEKVVFYLHESYDQPRVAKKSPPYEVKQSGYAGFNIIIDIYFKNEEEPKKVTFHYDMFLHVESMPPVNHTRVELLTFTNPADDFKKKLMRAGGEIQRSDEEKKVLAKMKKPKLNKDFRPPKEEAPKRLNQSKEKDRSSSSHKSSKSSSSEKPVKAMKAPKEKKREHSSTNRESPHHRVKSSTSTQQSSSSEGKKSSSSSSSNKTKPIEKLKIKLPSSNSALFSQEELIDIKKLKKKEVKEEKKKERISNSSPLSSSEQKVKKEIRNDDNSDVTIPPVTSLEKKKKTNSNPTPPTKDSPQPQPKPHKSRKRRAPTPPPMTSSDSEAENVIIERRKMKKEKRRKEEIKLKKQQQTLKIKPVAMTSPVKDDVTMTSPSDNEVPTLMSKPEKIPKPKSSRPSTVGKSPSEKPLKKEKHSSSSATSSSYREPPSKMPKKSVKVHKGKKLPVRDSESRDDTVVSHAKPARKSGYPAAPSNHSHTKEGVVKHHQRIAAKEVKSHKKDKSSDARTERTTLKDEQSYNTAATTTARHSKSNRGIPPPPDTTESFHPDVDSSTSDSDTSSSSDNNSESEDESDNNESTEHNNNKENIISEPLPPPAGSTFSSNEDNSSPPQIIDYPTTNDGRSPQTQQQSSVHHMEPGDKGPTAAANTNCRYAYVKTSVEEMKIYPKMDEQLFKVLKTIHEKLAKIKDPALLDKLAAIIRRSEDKSCFEVDQQKVFSFDLCTLDTKTINRIQKQLARYQA